MPSFDAIANFRSEADYAAVRADAARRSSDCVEQESPPLELSFVETLEELRDDWSRLAHDSKNLFATWEWISTWWRHFGRNGDRIIVSCRSHDGRLAAILPLYRVSTHGLRIIRFLGHGPADQLGPVCAPVNYAQSVRSLRELLDERLAGWNLFLGEQLPAEHDSASLLRARLISRTGTPTIRFGEGSWDDFLGSRSANFRQQVRRRERNVFRRHDAHYRLVMTSDDDLQRELDILFRLHRLRWGRRHSLFSSQEQFHREFAEHAQKQGWLRLWFLEAEGVPVAVWYGFRYCGTEYYYQAGRDPGLDRDALGFVLLSHTIRQALEDGVTEYRLLRGGEAYKYRFATEDTGLQTVGIAHGLAGRTALAAGIHSRRSRPLKAALKGIVEL